MDQPAQLSLGPAAEPDAPPRAYEDTHYPWNMRRVPAEAVLDGARLPHPARGTAIYVVHGIGDQEWTETAASLRSGFEDALELIEKWEAKHGKTPKRGPGEVHVPPPFVYDGYWSNYRELKETFKTDWELFEERERQLFAHLWKQRSSRFKTYLWFLWQQLKLLDPRLIDKVGAYYVLYWPLQLVGLLALTIAFARAPKVLTHFLMSVRLYLAPRGMIERALVQRIDCRVGAGFLALLGLDWEFRPLDEKSQVRASGKPITFPHVVWIAHSLGTVISYNVISDLLQRASELKKTGDTRQQAGVRRFHAGLRRFVTLGSPLDKVALLFGKKALRPWPRVTNPEANGADQSPRRLWWINFYSVLDPVSGTVSDELICGKDLPRNLHSGLTAKGLIPGLAHTHYWSDSGRTLRYILGRTFGGRYLPDREFKPYSHAVKAWLALGGYFLWAALLGAVICGLWKLVETPDWLKKGITWILEGLLGTPSGT